MITDTQRRLFETVINNLKPFGTDSNGHVIISSGNIPLELCYIDSRYQGSRKHDRIARLFNKWDIRKLAPITIVPHYDECRFAVVDGQGRCTVAPRKGMNSLQAIVLMNAPTDPVERLKFEAEMFIGQDSEVEKVKPIEKHESRVILGDSAAVILDKVMREYDIKTVANKGKRKTKVLGSYPESYAVAKSVGENGLRFVFQTIEEAGWSTEPNGYGRDFFRALKTVYVSKCRNKSDAEVTAVRNKLSSYLRQTDPTVFVCQAVSAYPNRDRGMAVVLKMSDVANM